VNLYNEWEKFPAQWTRNLIDAGHLPPGIVSQMDIRKINPAMIKDYDQCHFFNGIGGWSYALKLAGLSDVPGIWTGSCPCQPFSTAGKGRGEEDERHLWPYFRRLIEFGKPAIVFGEQVASPAGRDWLSGVRADLEKLGYAVGAADISAAGLGAPHIRQRLYWGAVERVSYLQGGRLWVRRGSGKKESFSPIGERGLERVSDVQGQRHERQKTPTEATRGKEPCDSQRVRNLYGNGCDWPWGDYEILHFADQKARRIKPGIVPVVDGFPGRVGQVRAYGNAIVPQVAAVFIESFMESIFESGGK